MFIKKFKVRVSYFGSGKYEVQYAHYRIFPMWHSLCFWFEQSVTSGTECWSTSLWSHEEAEKIAKTLKSIQDVNEYYIKWEQKKQDFYKRQEDYYNKNVPYQTKVIK